MRIRSSITGARHLVAQRGFVDALVEPHAVAVVLLVARSAAATSVFGAAHVDRRRICRGRRARRPPRRWCRWRRRRGPAAAACRRSAAPAGRAASGLPSVPPSRPRAPSAVGDRLDVVRRRAEVAQDRGDGVALLERDGPLVPGIAAGRLRGGLGQQRDVFRDDARLEAGIEVAVPSRARRPSAATESSRCISGAALAGVADPSWRRRARARAHRRSAAPPRSSPAAGRRRGRG